MDVDTVHTAMRRRDPRDDSDRDQGTPPEYLRRLGVTPYKALGQHFLVDEFILSDIATACELDPQSTILEVGAGPGGLTEELARYAGQVVAVELDEELAGIARRRLSGNPTVCVLAADILEFTPEELLRECGAEPPYVACGNLPYYITQPTVRRLLESVIPPERIVVMVQREVARRMVGGPGRESLLSMSIRCYGLAESLFDVPATAFWPVPKVQSSVIRIVPTSTSLATGPFSMSTELLNRFFKLLRAGFSEPRKQLHNALRSALGISRDDVAALLEVAGIDPILRAQHLSIEDWRRLYDAVEVRQPDTLDAG